MPESGYRTQEAVWESLEDKHCQQLHSYKSTFIFYMSKIIISVLLKLLYISFLLYRISIAKQSNLFSWM